MSEYLNVEQAAKLLNEARIAKAEGDGGWLYLALEDGRELEIAAEYGASLALTILPPPR